MPKDYERLSSMVRIQLEETRRNKNRNDMQSGSRGKGFPAHPKAKAGKSRQGMCHQFQKHSTRSLPSGECLWVHNEQEAAPSKGGRGRGKGTGNNSRNSSPANSPRGGKGGKPYSPRGKGGKPPTRRGTSPSGDKDKPTCRFFLNGNCTKMQTRLFFHPPACKFHKHGRCRLGTSCTFLHDTTPTALPSTAERDSCIAKEEKSLAIQ